LARIKNSTSRGQGSLSRVYPACLTHAMKIGVIIECSHIPRAQSYLGFQLEELHSRGVSFQLGLADTITLCSMVLVSIAKWFYVMRMLISRQPSPFLRLGTGYGGVLISTTPTQPFIGPTGLLYKSNSTHGTLFTQQPSHLFSRLHFYDIRSLQTNFILHTLIPHVVPCVV